MLQTVTKKSPYHDKNFYRNQNTCTPPYRKRQLPLAGISLLQQCRQLQYGDLALLMAHGQVLSLAVGGATEATHGHATEHVVGDQLADLLALVAAVVHAHVLEGALLRAQRRRLTGKLNLY